MGSRPALRSNHLVGHRAANSGVYKDGQSVFVDENRLIFPIFWRRHRVFRAIEGAWAHAVRFSRELLQRQACEPMGRWKKWRRSPKG